MGIDDLKSPWLAALAMVVVAALGAIGGNMQADKSAEPEVFRALAQAGAEMREELREEIADKEETIESQESEISDLRSQLREARLRDEDKSAKLRAAQFQISASASSTPRSTIRSLLRDMKEVPAWCNECALDQNTVRMLFVNPAYERFYKKRNLAYRNKTPIEMWGPRIGQIYLENDLRICREKSDEKVVELVQALGKEFEVEFYKFHSLLPGDIELACGMQLRTNEYIRARESGDPGAMAANDDLYMRVANW